MYLFSFLYASIFALLGWVFSTTTYIQFIDRLNPVQGLLLYYIVIFIAITLLQHIGLKIGDVVHDTNIQTIGTMMILFSFFIVVNWQSEYGCYVTQKDCSEEKVSQIFMNSEDGATFYLWNKITNNINTSRWLTYVFTPFLLTMIGFKLIMHKTHIEKLKMIDLSKL